MPRCTSCGEENPGGFRFCGACGTSLDEPARFETEERKIVTILFCDLVGFGFVLEHGQALLGVGRCFVGLGRKDEATKPLAGARSIFDGLGAQPLVFESDAVLG